MKVVGVSREYAVEWTVRWFPAAVLRGIGMPVSARAVQPHTRVRPTLTDSVAQLRRHTARVRLHARELEQGVAILRRRSPIRPEWELDAHIYVELGSEVMDLAYRTEQALTAEGHRAGMWAIRLVRAAFQLDPLFGTDRVIGAVHASYDTFFDAIALGGCGQLSD